MDLDTMPIIAFHDIQTLTGRNRTKILSCWLRFQMYTFLPITSGVIVPLFWICFLHPRKVISDKNYRQLLFMFMGHTLPPILLHEVGELGWREVWYAHLLASWLSFMYLFGHFALSHTMLDVVHRDDDISWVRYAAEHSVDIAVHNPVVNWLMGYLNYQVIHHLFPSMPQHRGPEVSLRWAIFCKQHGLKYTRLGYFSAWYQMLANLNDVGTRYYSEQTSHKSKHT